MTNVSDKRSNIIPQDKNMNKEESNSGKGTQFFEYGGYGHIRPKFPKYLRKRKKGLAITQSNSESEGERETATNVMAYFGRCVSEGETSIEDLPKEEVDTSFRFVLKETCLSIVNQKKTFRVLKKEEEELASTLTRGEDISSINSKLENLILSKIKLKKNSSLLDEKLEFGEMTMM